MIVPKRKSLIKKLLSVQTLIKSILQTKAMMKFNREEVVTMSGNGGTEPQQGDNFTDDSIMGSWGE